MSQARLQKFQVQISAETATRKFRIARECTGGTHLRIFSNAGALLHQNYYEDDSKLREKLKLERVEYLADDLDRVFQ